MTVDVVAAHFSQPLDVLFIDGGHGHDVAWADYEAWTPKVVVGGLLLIHDVFPEPRGRRSTALRDLPRRARERATSSSAPSAGRCAR